MENKETECEPRENGRINIKCVTSAKNEEEVRELQNKKGGLDHHSFQHQYGLEDEPKPDITEEEYNHYHNGYSSQGLSTHSHISSPHHEGSDSSGRGHNGYSSQDLPTHSHVSSPHPESSDSSGRGGNISTTEHSPSTYYDPSGILYEINHAYAVPSLEPIPENQVLSTINEEDTYQEPSSSSDSDPGNTFRNSQCEVFYAEEGGSGYSSKPSYSGDAENCLSNQVNQRDETLWEQDPKSEPFKPNISTKTVNLGTDKPHISTKTGNSSHDLLPSPEEQFQPSCLMNRLSSETSTVEDNEVENSRMLIYTPNHEPCFTSTKANIFPDQFDTRASNEIHHFQALDHSGHYRHPSNSDSTRDQNRKLSRNISFNITEEELSLQSVKDGTKVVDVFDQCNFPNPEESSSTTKPGHPDMDGGWAWVIMGCCFCSFVILMGLLFTCNLYYAEMLIEFGHSRSYTAWVGSLVNAFFMLGSIASSSFIQKFSCRTATILGSLIMSAGYIVSAFATSLEMIFVTYGFVVASGMNLVFSAAILVLAQYFNKRHCLATTIAMVGTGVGIFVMSQVLEIVIAEYGWRLSYLFCAAVALQLCICGSLLFPLPSSAFQSTREENDGLHREENGRQADGDIENQHFGSDSENDDDNLADNKTETVRRRGLRRRTSSANKHLYYQKDLLNKSFSSLNMSAQAGYLSHSLASLGLRSPSVITFSHHHNPHHEDTALDPRHYEGHQSRVSSRHHHQGNLSSNTLSRNESFASRTSSIMPSFLRSSQQSFSSKLSSAQVSISGIRSGHTSKLSLKDSRLDLFLHGLKSNPHSFSLRHSGNDQQQREETEQLCWKLDDLLEEDRSGSEEGLRDKESPSSGGVPKKCEVSRRSCCEKGLCVSGALLKDNEGDCGIPTRSGCGQDEGTGLQIQDDLKKASFLIIGGESDEEEDEDARSLESDLDFHENDGNICYDCFGCRFENMKNSIKSFRFETDPILKDPGMWCFAFAYFFCLLGSITMYVIFKDFATYKGLGDVSSMALSAAGIGDLIGRFGGGMLAASKIGNCVILYALSMTLSAIILGLLMVINNGTAFVITTAVFGILSGSQNIYIAITPSELFGREKLAEVFAVSVFLAGLGALVGSPLAGMVVDLSGGYLAVIIIEMVCCLIGSSLIAICYILNRMKKGKSFLKQATGVTSLDERRKHQPIKKKSGDEDTEGKVHRGTRAKSANFKDDTDSQTLRNMKLVRLSLMKGNKGDLKCDVSSPNLQSHNLHGLRQMNHPHHHHDLMVLQKGTRNKPHQPTSSTIKSISTHSSLHSLPSSRPRCGSYSQPNIQKLKRTSTCDSILHRSLKNDIVSIDSQQNTTEFTQNLSPGTERRYTIGTASTVTKPVNKKQTTTLYEMVLGKKMMAQMETQSDQNLSCASRSGDGTQI